jgi:hypothetical protein
MRQEKLDEAQRKAGQRRPDLSKPFKKGGKVKKFNGEDGSVVDRPSEAAAIRAEREGKDIYYTGRFKGEEGDDLYRKAYAQANRLREPSGAEVSEGKANTGLKEPSVRKAPSRPAFRRPAPKVSVAPSKKAESTYSNEGRGGSAVKPESSKPETSKAEAPFNPFEKDFAALKGRRGSRSEDIYPSLASKKAGGVVKKYAKGGGIEVKGKTRGKVC